MIHGAIRAIATCRAIDGKPARCSIRTGIRRAHRVSWTEYLSLACDRIACVSGFGESTGSAVTDRRAIRTGTSVCTVLRKPVARGVGARIGGARRGAWREC